MWMYKAQHQEYLQRSSEEYHLHSRQGLNIVEGKVVYKPVAEAWNLPYEELAL